MNVDGIKVNTTTQRAASTPGMSDAGSAQTDLASRYEPVDQALQTLFPGGPNLLALARMSPNELHNMTAALGGATPPVLRGAVATAQEAKAFAANLELIGTSPAQVLAAQQRFFVTQLGVRTGVPAPLAEAMGKTAGILAQGGTSVQALAPVLRAAGTDPVNAAGLLDWASGSSPEEISQHITCLKAEDPQRQKMIVDSLLDKLEGSAPEDSMFISGQHAAAPAPSAAPVAEVHAEGELAPDAAASPLARQLNQLSPYKSPHPSYEQYNVPPARYASADQVAEAIQHPDNVADVRGNSYTLGTFLGKDAQREGIVGQQVLDVLNTLRHSDPDPAKFEAQMKSLSMLPARRHELAQLAPSLEAFRSPDFSFADIAKDPTLGRAVVDFVGSTHNFGPQPEDFSGGGAIVQKLLDNKAFMAFCDKECLNKDFNAINPETNKPNGRPPVGVIMEKGLELKDGISRDLNEPMMGVQAVDRLLTLPRNASDLVPVHDLTKTPVPFPTFIADKLPGYSKDIQFAVKLNLAIANGLSTGRVSLTPQQEKTFNDNRLRLAWLSASELSDVLAKEASKSSPQRSQQIQGVIDQLQFKKEAVEKLLGHDGVKDLDTTGKTPEAIRQLMTPLMATSRSLYESVLAQGVTGEKKDAILKWVQQYADLTSLKQPAVA